MTGHTASLDSIKQTLIDIFDDAVLHDGYSDIGIEIKILKRGQKEVILHYGKQYRYVIDAQHAGIKLRTG